MIIKKSKSYSRVETKEAKRRWMLQRVYPDIDSPDKLSDAIGKANEIPQSGKRSLEEGKLRLAREAAKESWPDATNNVVERIGVKAELPKASGIYKFSGVRRNIKLNDVKRKFRRAIKKIVK